MLRIVGSARFGPMGEMDPERMQCQIKAGSNNGIGENRLEWKKIKKCFSVVGRSLKGMKVEKRSKTRGKRARRGFCKEYSIMTFPLQLTEHILSTC